MDFIFQTWPCYVSGFLIGIVMLSLIYFGKTFVIAHKERKLVDMPKVFPK